MKFCAHKYGAYNMEKTGNKALHITETWYAASPSHTVKKTLTATCFAIFFSLKILITSERTAYLSQMDNKQKGSGGTTSYEQVCPHNFIFFSFQARVIDAIQVNRYPASRHIELLLKISMCSSVQASAEKSTRQCSEYRS